MSFKDSSSDTSPSASAPPLDGDPQAHLPPPDGTGRIVILGAGIAGLTAAHDLTAQGARVTVIDREPRCGGSHRSRDIGPYTFDSGSVFFERRHPVFSMCESIRSACPEVWRKQRRIAPDGALLHYPFDPREGLRWPRAVQARAALDLMRGRASWHAPDNADAFCRQRLGTTAYRRLGLENYIARFHHEPPENIDVAFCQRRMGFVIQRSRWSALAQGLWRAARGKRRVGPVRRPLLVRPRAGFAAMYDPLRAQLEKQGAKFVLGTTVTGVRRHGDGYTVETSGASENADRVVSTVPIDALHRMAFGTGTDLESIDLLTLFVSVDAVPGTDANVLFNFHADGRWKRITIYSRIYGRAENRDYFAVEITVRKDQSRDPEAAFASFRDSVAPFGVFGADMRLEGFDIVPDAYPLYRKGCDALIADAIARVSDLGIASVGRQGRFEYLPISIQVVARTRDHLKEMGYV